MMDSEQVEQKPDQSARAVPDQSARAVIEEEVILKKPFPLSLILKGVGVLLAFFAGFAVWSHAAPISSAVIAPGVVSVDTYRKKIQHLEGGIIEAILVKDGDNVKKGDILVRLQGLAPTASVNRLKAEYFEALAIIIRLKTERNEAPRFPITLRRPSPDQTQIEAAIKVQKKVFTSRQAFYQERRSIIQKKIAQSHEETIGLQGQLRAAKKQIRLFDEELKDARKLYKKNLIRKNRLLTLRRLRSKLEGSQSEYRASIAQTKQKILELQLNLSSMRALNVSKAVEELQKQQARAYALSQKLITNNDVLKRRKILTPIDGIVVNLQIHSKGGVVAAGQPLMEIVPSSDKLVVDARISPQDIDEIRAGMPANVQLTSLGRRDRRPIKAVLQNISADRLIEPGTGKAFYRARILLDPEAVKQRKVTLLAGMGADVFIRTGTRTALEYLFDPVIRTFQHGLREQ